MKLQLKYYPDEILTNPCDIVLEFDNNLNELLEEMKRIMIENNGMGLAANQVGVSKKVFIMRCDNGVIEEFINPVLTEFSEMANIREGCLSSPNVYELVPTRAKYVTIEYQNRNGENKKAVLQDLEAVCAQHEYEHLLGIFWFDRLPSRQVKRAANKRWKKERAKLNV